MEAIQFQSETLTVLDAEHVDEYSGDERYLVLRGLTTHLRQQLVENSTQEHIMLWTPGDATDRFRTVEHVEAREAKGHHYYPLVEQMPGNLPKLAGIIWMHPDDSHGQNGWTYAVRLYAGYEGKGLASRHTHTVLEDIGRLYPELRTVWLSVLKTNTRASRLYERTGFGYTKDIPQEGKEIMERHLEPQHPKIVVIGGGTGSFTVLRGLKHYTDALTAVVNMSDDGGSTGRLRDELGVLPPGDVRQCLVALSEHEVLRELFEHRFNQGTLKGHSFGNLFLSAMEQMTGDFEEAVSKISDVLAIKGKVVPVTTTDSRLHARRADGGVLTSEYEIGHTGFGIERPEIWLSPEATLTSSAQMAISEADAVVIAPGNLYGSLAPALVVKGMAEALQETDAKVAYIANLVSKPDQTVGFKVHDFASEIERFIDAEVLDFVLYNTDEPTPRMLERYTRQGEQVIEFDLEALRAARYQAIGLPLIAKDPVSHKAGDRLASTRTLIRHDEDVLAREIIKLLSR